MLNVENWAEIRRLHRAEQMPIKAIARVMGVSRNTVRRALAADDPPRYERAPRGSIVDEAEPRIREVLQAWPQMPATVIAERIGWTRSMTVLKDRVRELRPVYLPPDPVSRTSYAPGELAQCDLWFPDVDVPLGAGQNGRGKSPVLVMVQGYSRWISARMIPSRTAEDLFLGHWDLLGTLGATPRALVWDNEGAVGRRRGGAAELTEAAHAFRGMLGITFVLCRPGDPEAKGLVERANGYLETSFLPGRSFTDPADFNTQLTWWLPGANTRHVRRLGARPADRIEEDRARMIRLPPVVPSLGWHRELRLGRDHYVRLGSNDYSVHPAAIGRKVQVRADLERVVVSCAGRQVASHVRCWARHQSITDPVHAEAAARLRQDHRAAMNVPAEVQVEHRVLTDYDRVLGIEVA